MPENTLYEMTGSVEQVVYRNEKNGYTVLELGCGDEMVTVVGTIPFVSAGEELHLVGTWANHATFGRQFKAEGCERTLPTSAAAILRYLSSGAVKGIGPATAAKIVEAFGENTLDIIENNPQKLRVIKGITKERAQKISEEFKRIYGMKEVMLSLSQYGITPEESVRVWKLWGASANDSIQSDPYALCEQGIGVPFERADAIAASLERPQDDACRVRAGLLHVLRHNMDNGHTCLPADKLIDAASRFLGVETSLAHETLEQLCAEGTLIIEQIQNRSFIFMRRMHKTETYSAGRMNMLLQYPPQSITGIEREIISIEKSLGIKYAELQKQAIELALSRGLLILTGGPGTGKTTTLNAIIQILEENGERVFLSAPTGRAAQRMSDVTGKEAKTIHRMLEVEWDETDQPTFKRNEKNLLECDALIVDELSMVDSSLFENMLRALPLGCRLIMVGDCDQLPSVGPGNVLGDLIASGTVPVIQLNEIFRQAMKSRIVTNAHLIVHGQMPELTDRKSDFFFLPADDAQTVCETIIGLCSERLPAAYGYSPFSDIQVLSPSRKGDLGTIELNRRLQAVINPPDKKKREITLNGTAFREGDKVMQIKNNYDIPWTKGDDTSGDGVFNGDVGILVEINKPSGVLVVQYDDRTAIYSMDDASDLELAYAVTVHKSQGSEFSAVVMPMFPGPPQLYYRNLLYTAVTRAKNLLIMVGRPGTVRTMVENDRKTKRFSGLRHFMTGEEDDER